MQPKIRLLCLYSCLREKSCKARVCCRIIRRRVICARVEIYTSRIYIWWVENNSLRVCRTFFFLLHTLWKSVAKHYLVLLNVSCNNSLHMRAILCTVTICNAFSVLLFMIIEMTLERNARLYRACGCYSQRKILNVPNVCICHCHTYKHIFKYENYLAWSTLTQHYILLIFAIYFMF